MKVRATSAEQARPWLELAGKFDVAGGIVSQEENEAGCFFIAIFDDSDQECGAFSLRLVNQTAWVVQAGGRLPAGALSAELLPALEAAAMAMGARSLAFATIREGLIHKMQNAGFEQSGVIMRKVLQ
jgi:hypothetical protein